MTRKYFYSVRYELNGVEISIRNPYLFDEKDDAYQYMGKAISEIVTANPGVVLNYANVSYEYH